jgi:hypothetical protein
MGSLPPAASINPLTPNYVVGASAAHAHTLGRRIWTEQWRRGGRVRAADGRDPLGSEPVYSFANQRFAPAPGGGAPLAPGDELITRCVYENTRASCDDRETSEGTAVKGPPVAQCNSERRKKSPLPSDRSAPPNPPGWVGVVASPPPHDLLAAPPAIETL